MPLLREMSEQSHTASPRESGAMVATTAWRSCFTTAYLAYSMIPEHSIFRRLYVLASSAQIWSSGGQLVSRRSHHPRASGGLVESHGKVAASEEIRICIEVPLHSVVTH